MKEKSAARSAS